MPPTPPPTSNITHNLPSAPTSPIPKRPKTETASSLQQTADMSANGADKTLPSKLLNSNEVTAQLRREEEEGTRLAMQVKKLSDKAKSPTRGSDGSAGWDLYCAETTTIQPWTRALLPTHIAISVPPSTYGRVAPRSGLSVKHGLTTGAGVIDADYRGEIKVLMFNLSGEECIVKEGDRCAQLVLERCLSGGGIVEVDELGGSARGAGGFGSTGK